VPTDFVPAQLLCVSLEGVSIPECYPESFLDSALHCLSDISGCLMWNPVLSIDLLPQISKGSAGHERLALRCSVKSRFQCCPHPNPLHRFTFERLILLLLRQNAIPYLLTHIPGGFPRLLHESSEGDRRGHYCQDRGRPATLLSSSDTALQDARRLPVSSISTDPPSTEPAVPSS